MARKANIAKYGLGFTAWDGQLERFAELVAAAEREECAQLCEAEKPTYQWAQCSQYQAGQYEMAEYLVEAIRARVNP